ncbi:DUF6634 family protein [Devosia sp. MC521]|uniref:DUF6634 family protein n=1 Tax=Devosia sp. MC521 TaxID=2759954 RepID=UPI0015FD4B60|nr:DUF6634 family protein [Devosia sp. MC521]MBJ6986085.1 hypothetical protein [Devosia sp. MC521]QMW61454.1 hypothetical protein H4N61_10730 [Devosia sp. MC521]
MNEIIIRNSVRCLLCGEEIVSEDRHDFRYCSCGSVAVDGGNAYTRRVYKTDGSWVDTSIIAQREPEDLGDINFGEMQEFADRYHNHGWRPGKLELANAPVLSQWSWRDDGRRRIIVGIVTGHDDADDGTWLATTTVIAIDDDESWCRSTRSFYRLGEPA